jgi:eukaryotic-like serine/threonine-protein kinase
VVEGTWLGGSEAIIFALMTLVSGSKIGPYEIVGPLGAGGMGEVYRGRDTKLGRDVALKVLPEAFARDAQRMARFQREAKVLASLNHPNIASIYGLEDSGPTHALVMEVVEGPTLASRIKSGSTPIDEALGIAKQMCDALEYAHERGIVHRDLKPSNVKMTNDGAVKILDFGLAKALHPDESSLDTANSPTISLATEAGILLGTAAYMSPEQARGKAVDRRADIWAFGCVLYEMLAGKMAFRGESATDTLAAVIRGEPDWSRLPSSTPPRVRALLQRCLQKDPKQRLRDIGDARIEIEDALSPAATPSETERSRAKLSRDRLAWVAAGLSAAALTVVIAWSIWRTPKTDQVPRLSHAVRLTNTAAQEFGPAVSPDGKWVAYYSNARGPTDIWVKFYDSGAALNLTSSLNLELPTRVTIGGLAISPDGATLAFSARPDPTQTRFDTWIIPAPIGGVPRKLLENLQGCQWSPDGAELACIRPGSSRGDALLVVNTDGSNQREIVPPEAGHHVHWPAWSRDGKYLYFIYTFDTWQAEPAEIWRILSSGGKPEPVVQTVRRAEYPVPLPGGDLIYAANPDTVDLGLWWKPAGGGAPQLLAPGVGEYTDLRLSSDRRKIVMTLSEVRQSLVLIPLLGGSAQARRLTDGYSGDIDPTFDPRGGRLVFSSSRSGHRNLWMSREDGSQPTPLTTEASIDERPAFSPDGQAIAFLSDRGGRRGIWVMNANGGAPKFLHDAVVLDTLTWSPDGKRILYAVPGGDLPRLESVSVADGQVDSFSVTTGATAPAWSPVGEVLAYLQPVTVLGQGPSFTPAIRTTLRFADGQGRPLPTEPPKQVFSNGFLAWSRDARHVAAVWNPAYAASSIWIVDPSGREPLRKLGDLPITVRPRGITWTPDGSGVVIAEQESISDIVMFDVER